MRIAVVNESGDPRITRESLERIVGALRRQSGEHYAPFWQSAAAPIYIAQSVANVTDLNDSVLALLRDPDQADVLGDHETANGRPFMRVFTAPIFANGGTLFSSTNSISATLSHELLETLGDPYVSWWADTAEGDEEAIELCDRVESDGYKIDGIFVSNFLGPRAFSAASPGPYDWMRRLTSAWEMTPGGYCIRRSGGPSGAVRDVFGESFPAWKREIKNVSARWRGRHAMAFVA